MKQPQQIGQRSSKLIPEEQRRQMLENGWISRNGCHDPLPVIKLFTPDANCTWLLTELDPEDHDIAFGLCDLGLGFPELGYVSIEEISRLRGRLGLPVERDLWFNANKTLSAYAEAAHLAERIVA